MRRWVCKLSTNPPRLPTRRNTNCTFIIIPQILKSHSWLLSWMDFHISGWISLPGKTNICHFSLKYGYSVRADRIPPGSGLPSQCKLKYCNRANQTFMGSVKFTRLLESTEVPLTKWLKTIFLLLTKWLDNPKEGQETPKMICSDSFRQIQDTFYTFIFEYKMYRTRWQMNRNTRHSANPQRQNCLHHGCFPQNPWASILGISFFQSSPFNFSKTPEWPVKAPTVPSPVPPFIVYSGRKSWNFHFSPWEAASAPCWEVQANSI